MTNRRRFFCNGILLTLAGLAVRGVGLFFSAFLGRTIGAEALGLFTLIGTIYAFSVSFASSGISLTVTRLVSSAVGEGRIEKIRPTVRSAVIYALFFSSLASFALGFGAKYFANEILSDVRAELPLRILSVSLIPIALSAVFSGYFIGVKRIRSSSSLQILSQLVKIGITVVLVLKMAKESTVHAVVALCISTTLAELTSFLVAFLEFLFAKEEKGDGASYVVPVMKMALPLALSACVRSLLLTVEHVLIPKQLLKHGEGEGEALASYGVLHGMALPLLLYPMSPLSSFSSILVPELSEAFARGEKKRIKRIADEVMEATLFYAAPVSVLIYFFSEELGYILYSSYSAGIYIAYLVPVIPIMYLDHVTDSVLKGIGEHVYSMWINISDSFLSIFLVWLLIPIFGIRGYALVIIIMEIYNFTFSYLRLKKRTGAAVRPIRSIVIPAATAFAAALIADMLMSVSGNGAPTVFLVLKLIFAVCIYLALNFSVRFAKGKKLPCC